MTSSDEHIYSEILIKLIELNDDRTWDKVFHSLREGKNLPGGGAGSLNDWGPYYINEIENSWYPLLYDILRFLYDNRLAPSEFIKAVELKNVNQITLLKCKNCNAYRQHPRSFETQLAKLFFSKHLIEFLNEKNWPNLFLKEYSYESEFTNIYRDKLIQEYKKLNVYVGITNKINPMKHCPNCKTDADFEHVNFKIKYWPFFRITIKK